jgi:putative SOS response-associated peptidase YedK
MCGRFTQKQETAIVAKMHGVDKVVSEISTSFNVAPGQNVAVIAGHKERRLGALCWGLPAFKADGRPLINARAETLSEKPTFSRLIARNRCLIVADGFYEWREIGGRKQPVYIHMKDDASFVFAGLWDSVQAEHGKSKSHCTIITTRANSLIAPVHHRMPVILPPASVDAWLDAKYTDPVSLLQPYPSEAMALYPVSNAVNSTRNDGPELIRPLEHAE